MNTKTPGLGGEVDNPNWKGGWKGKKIFTETGAVNLKVVKAHQAQITR